MTPEIFAEACRNAIAKVKRVTPESVIIRSSDPLSLYGLDSLDVMNFLLELEQASGVPLDEVDPAVCNTVDLLYQYIQRQQG